MKSVVIQPIIQGEHYRVNQVDFMLIANNWQYDIDPTMKELEAFHFYRKAQIENTQIKRHTRAVYNK